jgi:hypothetical protein
MTQLHFGSVVSCRLMAAPNKIQFNGAGGLRIHISFTRIDGLVDRALDGVSS